MMLLLFFRTVEAQSYGAIVADSLTHTPLPNASVFGKNGNLLGISRPNGRLPFVSETEYPVTVRYMGFKEKTLNTASGDTVFLQENIYELPELVIDSRQHKYLHLLAYVREYSTLSTYTDTIFLFREKMVDFIIPSEKNSRFKGWRKPRLLASESYYRFTDSQGLDSVSDHCRQHFSWTDWVGIVPEVKVPDGLCKNETASDTVHGKYSATEIWQKNEDRLSVDINVLADTLSRKWVPNLSLFFHDDIDFEQFRIRFNYDNATGDYVLPINLTGYSYTIESNGRGHSMFMFNRVDEPFFVSTYAEVYIIDKEYIPFSEVKKWDKQDFSTNEIAIFEPTEAPDLQESIRQLIDRVNNVDHEQIRLARIPDHRLAGRNIERVNAGQLILRRLKGMFGIDKINGQRKMKRQWHQYRTERTKKNNSTND